MTLLAIAGAVLVVLLLYIAEFSYAARLMQKIPGNPGWPVFRNIFDSIKPPDKVFQFMRDTHKRYGGIIGLYGFNLRAISICNPEDIETILSTTRFNIKTLPYLFLKPWLGEGLLTSNGGKWVKKRKLLTTAFHFNILKQFTDVFIENTERFMQTIQNEVAKEKTDLFPLLANATFKIMCETSFGTSLNDEYKSITDAYFDSVRTLNVCLAYRAWRLWLYSDWIFNLSKVGKKYNESVKNLHAFTNKIIKDKKEARKNSKRTIVNGSDNLGTGKKPMALIDLLLDSEEQGQIDEVGLREEVDTFLFGGHDTSTTAMHLLIMRLANEPEIQEKVFKEMQEIFGDSLRPPTVDDLSQMKYLECCIKEALRLYPPAPTLSREITEEVVLSGYKVPVGTQCFIQIYDMHHSEALYPEPEKFIPERFLPENSKNRHAYAHLPFSAGPRNCIGQKFARLEMKTMLSSLIRRYRFEPITKPEEVTFISALLLTTSKPVYARFVPRDNISLK